MEEITDLLETKAAENAAAAAAEAAAAAAAAAEAKLSGDKPRKPGLLRKRTTNGGAPLAVADLEEGLDAAAGGRRGARERGLAEHAGEARGGRAAAAERDAQPGRGRRDGGRHWFRSRGV